MEFLSPLGGMFVGHWKKLRGSNLMPHTSLFLDNALPDLAPITSIIEVFDGELIIRLQGTAIVDRWGDDKTGFSFFDMNPLLPRREILENVHVALRHACGLRSRSKLGNLSNRVSTIETISLPLAVDDGRPLRIVNISSVIEALGYDGRAKGLVAMTFEWIDLGNGVPAASPIQVIAAAG